jgi:hypothetical protein
MTSAAASQGILLVDDGELDEVARVLDEQGIAYDRLRGGLIPNEVPPPRDLLIVTPRRVERVRRGSPADAKPGRPLRITAVDEDSPAMRRRLRRSGLHLLIRLPAQAEIWRLLVARALYKGSERRVDPRVAIGSPVFLDAESSAISDGTDSEGTTTLIDLSNRGCRLRTSHTLEIGEEIDFSLPANADLDGDHAPLTLRGRVRRLTQDDSAQGCMVAVVFDSNLPGGDRTRLTALINHWASGPRSLDTVSMADAPSIPACQLPSLPDLTLDDETDPPIQATTEVRVKLEGADPRDSESDRRVHSRGQYEAPVSAETAEGPFVLIGRDLSPGGMCIERHPELHLGDAFKVSLRGPGQTDPLVVDAKIIRDDGPAGFGVSFASVGRETAIELEKMVACLPDVESLEEGEIGGLGAILSEIISD